MNFARRSITRIRIRRRSSYRYCRVNGRMTTIVTGNCIYIHSRRVLNSSMVVMLIISVLQIWICSDCRAGAIRVFPGNEMRKMIERQELFQTYFNGTSFSFKGSDKGFEDSKRRVPSCPDPLHN
ncbi:hypothetical protein Gotri_015119 [Gossypium trilobum]|uniref:Uncharacterized protein n=1 Tax=Gossypium trilobum TaxID=34281 RepID=A0A7J9DZ37_9ROSI|nr:hypothetical protein [Gossypium trilobum]